MNPVVVKMPPPMMLLTRTQEAVNQPIVCADRFEAWSLISQMAHGVAQWNNIGGFPFCLSFPTIPRMPGKPALRVPRTAGLCDVVANLLVRRPV